MRISVALGWDENVLFAVTAFYCALANQGENWDAPLNQA